MTEYLRRDLSEIPIISRFRFGPVKTLQTAGLLSCVNFEVIQRWPKKCVLGCVIPPAGAVARLRNLGRTFLANSVNLLPLCLHRRGVICNGSKGNAGGQKNLTPGLKYI